MDRWLLQRDGNESYHSTEELQSLARAGRLGARDLVYHPVRDRWMYVDQAEELRATLSAPASAMPVPPHAPTSSSSASSALALRPSVGGLSRKPETNDSAVAGFTLGILGIIPVVGAVCALVGLPLSMRGLRRAAVLDGTNRGFAVAGLILTLTALLLNGGLTLLAILG